MTTTQQVALVTGANKGIGFETARQLGLPWTAPVDHDGDGGYGVLPW